MPDGNDEDLPGFLNNLEDQFGAKGFLVSVEGTVLIPLVDGVSIGQFLQLLRRSIDLTLHLARYAKTA